MSESTIKDLQFDRQNARLHPARNLEMLEHSLAEIGAARSIVIDEENTILAGNGVIEAALAQGLAKLQVVEADGETIVAVRRKGLTAEQKKKLAYYDNRTAELAEWDIEQILADQDEGLDFDSLFDAGELELLIEAAEMPELEAPKENRSLGNKRKQIKAVLYADELQTFERALLATGIKNRGEAITAICRAYLNEKGQLDISEEMLFALADA